MFTSFRFIIKIATTAASCHKELCMYRIGAVLGLSSPKSHHERQQPCSRHAIIIYLYLAMTKRQKRTVNSLLHGTLQSLQLFAVVPSSQTKNATTLRKSKDNDGHKFPRNKHIGIQCAEHRNPLCRPTLHNNVRRNDVFALIFRGSVHPVARNSEKPLKNLLFSTVFPFPTASAL